METAPPTDRRTDKEFAAALERMTTEQLYHFVWMLRGRGLLPFKMWGRSDA